MNLLKRLFATGGGWEECEPPKWFDEWRLRRRVGYPQTFKLKGKTFFYKAIKLQQEQQGNTLRSIYQFYRKKRRGRK